MKILREIYGVLRADGMSHRRKSFAGLSGLRQIRATPRETMCVKDSKPIDLVGESRQKKPIPFSNRWLKIGPVGGVTGDLAGYELSDSGIGGGNQGG